MDAAKMDEEYTFEHLMTSAPASVALMGQSVLMTMMGTDASLLFNSYDGQVTRDAEGALKIFQWASTIRSDVVHLVLCGCRAIEVGETYVKEVLKGTENQQPLNGYSNVIRESQQMAQMALRQAIDHSKEILLQLDSFLTRYPRKPTTTSTSTPAGSVYSTVELMRQALTRSEKAYDQLNQAWHKYGLLFSKLIESGNSIHLLNAYLRISRDYICPAANSVRALLAVAFEADLAKNESATTTVEKARDELMAAYNNACETIKTMQT